MTKYTPSSAGDGVYFGFETLKPGIMARIEALGKLNDGV